MDTKKRILIVEDSASIRASIAELLLLKGYQIETAINGEEGVALVHTFKPHLVLCDIMMPKMDGHQVLQEIRKIPGATNTPFIFLTAKVDTSDMRQGMILGADDYLTKPFKASELFEAVAARLDRHEKVKEEVYYRLEDLIHFMGNMDDPL